MDYTHLSKRLHRVGEFVPEGSILADIGSDHAYLPAYLVLNKRIESAIAGEVVEGPFQSAKNLVAELNLTSSIQVRKGDGLDVLNLADEVDAISICGMGGTLIKDILDRGYKNNRLSGNEVLLLQPNVGEKTLRTWLMDHSYIIIEEDIVRENEKTYEIIIAKKAEEIETLSEKELMFGPKLLNERNDIFKNKWCHELKQLENISKQLEKSSQDVSKNQTEINKKIALIKEVIG
ncbi:tRNA (adenine(22)-N(1))-methyltransferase [Vagococcus carniphilus]|uniref:tRNA (Adenine(22)-N(1))-methyltransferase TrmK n=1 Tax=Vagococcus carniphilus TaxID=218144 RepID=A0AAW8U3P5_9ENTE|nr:tRNA (adenine(22)-N(1))-methyltransferase TrmK [Vagococcus carniphilus]MDT2815022.1 tRNA (adenine(22)-N(1))-methyltransferase TrmK [Vagococcus carniphilus]MDT2829703.1 tRNA (adenine(22)-N(1))-methyltransferase TrmK [Vagococcus carniphilus]MDT2834176.1 tRNA (adenine(22)-N(1))-methyltransferase TrmK [Vagococcus carniphilus]MDT2839162.1 tRNA (adenine(22)-N(1))-methyltransferase TrmK [Vagococcus carniphilus]MDT2853220.1 tRNA (adenine(22)-N(1))-methyltransferase TrmK [Vagococcus carniphilus]